MRAVPAPGSWAEVLDEGRLPRFVLICLAIWLNAADSLVTTTIMPSVGRALGGYAYLGWATAGYLMASVLAGASSGVLALRLGLRAATMAAALLYAGGCVLSAVAPDIFTFMAGRALQGIGGGWLAGLSSAAIGLLFANRLLPRVYSASSSVWGVAVLVGPMLGGLLADAGSWRAVFGLFALQGAAVAVAAMVLLPSVAAESAARKVAWRQLSCITLGIALIAASDLAGSFIGVVSLVAVGVGTMLLALKSSNGGTVRLFPVGSGDPRTIHGAGYITLFLFYVATMGLTVYGPAVLQTLRGLSSLAAGYLVGVEALCWTSVALPVAGLTGPWPIRLIRLGAVAVFAGVGACALVFAGGHLATVIGAAGLVGVGLGLSYAFICQAILGDLADDERTLGGAGIATVRLTGAAVGSAFAGAVANLAGFAQGFSATAAQTAGLWIFLAALPVAAMACLSAWNIGRPATAPARSTS